MDRGSLQTPVQGFVQVIFIMNEPSTGAPRVRRGGSPAGNRYPGQTLYLPGRNWPFSPLPPVRPARSSTAGTFSRSSALSMALMSTPMSRQLYFSQIPKISASLARFNAVCPPIGRQYGRLSGSLPGSAQCSLPSGAGDILCPPSSGSVSDRRRVAVDKDHLDPLLPRKLRAACVPD